MYIAETWYNRPEYNDSGAPFDAEIHERLCKHGTSAPSCFLHGDHRYSGIDNLLAKHLSHLFIRDPLVIFRETIDQNDTISTDHFEACVFIFPLYFA